ncbi:carbonic anhydrase [Aquabacterium sp.]|uniref:carbonic anhydrase n=1 Tax=Aquabacterium sp. TaxID=1872578 RepID=UPI0035B0F947
MAGPLAAAATPATGLCESGQRQSPIDITLTQPQALPALQTLYPPPGPRSPLRVVNDGHTVRVRFAPGSHLLIGREALTLQQFHFHTPGGDQLRGESFPMAMHWLHKRASGQLVSMVVLFRLGADNAALAELLPHLPAAGEPERPLALGTAFDPTRLLPAHRGYYAYEGSLTAPPCTEGVQWLVLKEPLSLSATQLQRLHTLFADNARPVQPLHGRVVRESR